MFGMDIEISTFTWVSIIVVAIGLVSLVSSIVISKVREKRTLYLKPAKNHAYKIALAGTMTAIAVIVAFFFNMDVPIFGIPGLRVSFHGPFMQFISVMLGPVFGGMAAAVRDLINFQLRGTGAFLWQMTLIEFLNGAAIGLLWTGMRKVKVNIKWFSIAFGGVIFVVFIAFGALNFVLTQGEILPVFLRGFNTLGIETLTWGLMATGFAGLIAMVACHSVFHFIYRNAEDKEEKLQRVFKLLIAVGIPTMMMTFVNSIVIYVVWGVPVGLVYFTIPRLARRVLIIFYDVFILAALISVYEKAFKRKKKPVMGQGILADNVQSNAHGD